MNKKTKTQLSKEARADWELNAWEDDAMTQREKEKQESLLKSWKNIYSSGDEARIKEMEIARRISAATEEDTLEKRVQQSVKEFKAGQMITDRLQALAPQGQSVEEFQEETDIFGRRYRQIVKEVRKEVGL